MPYKMSRQGEKYCILNSDTGENKGCSASRSQAVAHMRALYANEKEADPDAMIVKAIADYEVETGEKITPAEIEESLSKGWNEDMDMLSAYPSPATSYEQLDAEHDARERMCKASDLIARFPMLANNVMRDPTIEDKAAGITTLADELAARLQELDSEESDGMPSEGEMKETSEPSQDTAEDKAISKREDVSPADKKRAVGEYGSVRYADSKNKKYPIDTPEHIRAAWSYINMPRNASKYSPAEVASIKSAIVSAWKSKIDKKGPPQAKKSWVDNLAGKVADIIGVSNIDTSEEKELAKSSMMVFKGEDGQYVWVARYSNKFRDNDVVPEIISDRSHRQFVDIVDKGLAPYPELWLWHVKDWNIGRASWLAYDSEGFALAAGFFNKGCEPVAEWLIEHQDEMGVSHGMPVKSILRDPDDPTVIVHHITSEISPLPSWAAANKRTGFFASRHKDNSAPIDEEVDMIPQGKKEALKAMGLTDEMLGKIEAMNATDAAKATAEGVESKENAEAAPAAVEAAAPPAPVSEAPKTEEAPKEDEPKEDEPKELPISRKEIADAFAPVFQSFTEKMEALEATVKEITAKLEVVDKSVKDQGIVNQSPAASLAAMFAANASRSKETEVLADNPLLNMKPKEHDPVVVKTGIPFIDQMTAPTAGRK